MKTHVTKISVSPGDKRQVEALKEAMSNLQALYKSLKEYNPKNNLKTSKGMEHYDFVMAIFAAFTKAFPKELRKGKEVDWKKAYKLYGARGVITDKDLDFVFSLHLFMPPDDEELKKTLKQTKDPLGRKMADSVKEELMQRVKYVGKLMQAALKLINAVDAVSQQAIVVKIPTIKVEQSYQQYKLAQAEEAPM